MVAVHFIRFIGNNGPFPLLIYCALPIASPDLIECIYCLNDLFFSKIDTDRQKTFFIRLEFQLTNICLSQISLLFNI